MKFLHGKRLSRHGKRSGRHGKRLSRSLTFAAFLLTILPGTVNASGPSLVAAGPSLVAGGPPLTVAVAANALRPVKEIARAFEASEGIKLRLVAGSTGKLYAQIVQGAPFDVFLAADAERPALLEKNGLTVEESRFTYALGVLALWSAGDDIRIAGRGLSVLNDAKVGRIAIANPKTAPYGRAAIESLESAGMLDAIREKLVFGESVSQAFGFARSGNADLAIVALSTIYGVEGENEKVDENSYSPIVQQGVVLKDSPPSAKKFTEFLLGPEGQAVFEKYGYGINPSRAAKIPSAVKEDKIAD